MIMMYSHVLGAKAEVDEAPTSAAAAASMVLRLNIMVLVVGMYFLLQRRLIMAAITARFMEWAKIDLFITQSLTSPQRRHLYGM